MNVDVDPQRLLEKETDDRGRLTLGAEYANQTVKVLVVE